MNCILIKLEGIDELALDIPLQKISFDANVTGTFAQVVCEQEFKNKNKSPVEAVYVFPLPENASISGCEMLIGDKKIDAELKEKKQAKQEYKAAVDAGHHASLLEQNRDNIFTVSVGGIEPNENIKIITIYNQKVDWQNNGGRFTIPTVVAPRFIPGQPIGTKIGNGMIADTDRVPDASQITPTVIKEGVDYTVDIKVSLSPGFRCLVTSPSHKTLIGEKRFVKNPIEIEARGLTPDRDFILSYVTGATAVETVVHTGSFANEKFAVIDIVPPGDVIAQSKDIIFCLDFSGSMSGAKLQGLKIVAEKVARRLFEQDKNNRVGVIVFEDEIHPMHPLSEINDDTIDSIQKLESMGGTMAGKAIDFCRDMLPDEGRDRYILLVSDGQTADKWQPMKPGVRVVSVGIGTAVNMAYLKEIAYETGGVSLSVYPGEDYDSIATILTGYLAGPILTDIELTADGKALSDVQGIADVYSSMPAFLTFKMPILPETVQLLGTDNLQNKISIDVDMKDAGNCAFAHQLWAREKLRGQNLIDKDAISTSLKYGVLCNKTAFIAVHLKDIAGQKPEKVEIPVSLPATWNYDRIFGNDSDSSASASSASSSGNVNVGSILSGNSPLDVNGKPAYPSSLYVLAPLPLESSIHIIDILEFLVKRLEILGRDCDEAMMEWDGLSKFLTAEYIAKWSAIQKAKAWYYLLRLGNLGFIIPENILKLCSIEPPSCSGPKAHEAREWWDKAYLEYIKKNVRIYMEKIDATKTG